MKLLKKIIIKIRSVISWILFIAMFMILGASLYVSYQSHITGEQAYFFGYKPIFVETGSMEPYMKTHSVVLAKQITDISQVNVDDVITFHVPDVDGNDVLITHRLIFKDETGKMRTKGDNNAVVDGVFIYEENLEAKVVAVYNQAAWLYDTLQTTKGKFFIGSIVVVVIFALILLNRLINKFLYEFEDITVDIPDGTIYVEYDKADNRIYINIDTFSDKTSTVDISYNSINFISENPDAALDLDEELEFDDEDIE